MKGITRNVIERNTVTSVVEYQCDLCSFTTKDSNAAKWHYGHRHSYVDSKDIDEVGIVYYIETREDQELLYDRLTSTRDTYIRLSAESFTGPNWYVTCYDYNDEVTGFQTVDEALDRLAERYQALELAQIKLINLLTTKPNKK